MWDYRKVISYEVGARPEELPLGRGNPKSWRSHLGDTKCRRVLGWGLSPKGALTAQLSFSHLLGRRPGATWGGDPSTNTTSTELCLCTTPAPAQRF